MLKPVSGHLECSVGMKISHFTTVDGTRSIPVSADMYFPEVKGMVEMRIRDDKKDAGRRSIVCSIYTPNVKIRRMARVEERPESVKRLR